MYTKINVAAVVTVLALAAVIPFASAQEGAGYGQAIGDAAAARWNRDVMQVPPDAHASVGQVRRHRANGYVPLARARVYDADRYRPWYGDQNLNPDFELGSNSD
jgi:hypothetical protein